MQGRIQYFIGSNILPPRTHFFTTPSHLPTSIALSSNSLFISTKRGCIFRYSLLNLRKVGKPFGQARSSGPRASISTDRHQGEILCLAASEDGKWLVSGGRDRVIGVWNVEADEPRWVTGMRGHKDAIAVRCLCNNETN